jgi:hypothetical protein
VNLRAVALAAAFGAATASPTAARQVISGALVDRDLTVGAGATIAATLGETLARVADAHVPHRLFDEHGIARRGTNVTFRLLKLAWFDAPQEHLLLVVNHEVFGHGARLRERFDGPITYSIGVPSPYGRGGGSTSFVFDRAPSAHEAMAVHAGGMEVDGVAAALTFHRAFSAQRMSPRDAVRYLAFELDTLSYVLSTDDDGEEPGHDVADYLETYNRVAAAAGAAPLTPRALRRQALVGFANPMFAYAAYGIGRYLATGATDVAVPALSIAGVRYLPMFRYRLAPYGTEWSLVNELGGRIRPTQIELRVGRAPHATPWGVRARQRELRSWRDWSLDASIEVWRQPPLVLEADDPLSSSPRTGVHVRGRVERPLLPVWFSADRATIVVDVGVKSAGFVPGEPLRGGLVVRGGVGLPLR